MGYKKIDLKTILDDQFLEWYNNELNVYFLLLYENKITNASDNIEKLTGCSKNILIEKELSEIFKNENLNFLLNKLKIENEEYILLPEPISNKNIKAKWKKRTINGENVTFLLLKEETNVTETIEKAILPIDETSLKKESIDKNLSLPYIIINNDVIYKSEDFEKIFPNENLSNYSDFLNWIKEKIKIDINEPNLDSYCSIFQLNSKSYLCYFKKINETKIIILSEVKSYQFDNEENAKLKQMLENITKEKEDLEKLNENYKIEIEQVKEKIEKLQKAYEEKESKEQDEKNKINVFVKDTTEEMKNLNELISIIEEISIKIHLISINAAIESARVGEAGKGFSVIAKELEKLSELTKNYTKTLTHQINQITEKIKQNLKKI